MLLHHLFSGGLATSEKQLKQMAHWGLTADPRSSVQLLGRGQGPAAKGDPFSPRQFFKFSLLWAGHTDGINPGGNTEAAICFFPMQIADRSICGPCPRTENSSVQVLFLIAGIYVTKELKFLRVFGLECLMKIWLENFLWLLKYWER